MTDRKKDHIELALKSQTESFTSDDRFNYEPLLNAHPTHIDLSVDFLGKRMKAPIWVSSMTGGTKQAEKINHNIARVCHEFGLGMGLGSCRVLLENDTFLNQFDVRKIIGPDLPLFANLGIAQIERLITEKKADQIDALVTKLQADGLMIHVNPIQEFLQPEGDLLTNSPLETIEKLLGLTHVKIIIKEVGQGMGPESLKSLLKLPVAGIEFGAYGGTNFASLELFRSDPVKQHMYEPLSKTGHTAIEMLEILNQLKKENPDVKKQLIISGGIKTFLDGYYLIKKSDYPAVYGQASAFLKYAKEEYSKLKEFVEYQVNGLKLAYNFLTIKK